MRRIKPRQVESLEGTDRRLKCREASGKLQGGLRTGTQARRGTGIRGDDPIVGTL